MIKNNLRMKKKYTSPLFYIRQTIPLQVIAVSYIHVGGFGDLDSKRTSFGSFDDYDDDEYD